MLAAYRVNGAEAIKRFEASGRHYEAPQVLAFDYMAVRILEDGSSKTTYPGSDGARHPVPDLATAATDAVLARLGLESPEDALAFFQRHPARDFRRRRIERKIRGGGHGFRSKVERFIKPVSGS